ncbi:MAG TPA: diguanylate phosphodiesterase, partial [Rhodocyclaceae bacterium]|nr:diguanylate phosphodiesterase [Rhodocyclaceae bacterium]
MNGATTDGNVFLGRLPLLDRQQQTLGFELLFQPVGSAHSDNPELATAETVCGAFAELGLAKALGKQLAFIPVDEHFVCNDLVQVLPAEQVVLVLKACSSPAVIERCRELRAAGYTLAVDDCEGLDFGPLLTLASYARIDVA